MVPCIALFQLAVFWPPATLLGSALLVPRTLCSVLKNGSLCSCHSGLLW